MTDKELLELAAKAMGYKWCEKTAKIRDEMGVLDLWITEPTLKTSWNPLKSKGYAYALDVMAKLCIDVTFEKKSEFHAHDRVIAWSDIHTRHDEFITGNPADALCRAITRAAAEIGKSM